MKEIVDKDNCCGCELCVEICPQKAIKMVEDKTKIGFAYPVIEEDKCTNCSLCLRMCIAKKQKKKNDLKPKSCIGGYIKEKEKIMLSASGGGWIAIVEMFRRKYANAVIAGVAYDDDYKGTSYVIAKDDKEIRKTIGTKYSQAKKQGIYKRIEKELVEGNKVLVGGLPCEITALKTFINQELQKGLYTIDLVCQGPTSNAVLREYNNFLEKKFQSPIKYYNVREKLGKEWIPQWLRAVFDNGKEYAEPFYFTAVGNIFHNVQRQSCRNCRFISDRKSDITLGDFHGVDRKTNYYNPKGTSGALIWTEKGLELLNLISDMCLYEEIPKEYFMESNPRSRKSICWSSDELHKKYMIQYKKYGLFMADWLNCSTKEKILKLVPYRIRTLYRKKRSYFNEKYR